MSAPTAKQKAAARKAAAVEKDKQAKANALHEKLGSALRAKNLDEAAELFAAGAKLLGAA